VVLDFLVMMVFFDEIRLVTIDDARTMVHMTEILFAENYPIRRNRWHRQFCSFDPVRVDESRVKYSLFSCPSYDCTPTIGGDLIRRSRSAAKYGIISLSSPIRKPRT